MNDIETVLRFRQFHERENSDIMDRYQASIMNAIVLWETMGCEGSLSDYLKVQMENNRLIPEQRRIHALPAS